MSVSLSGTKLLGLVSAISLCTGLSYGQTLSGSYTVGAGGNYPNLTGPTGLFNAVNANGLNGDVNVLIISDITEPATDSLKDYTSGGTNNYHLTIRPDAALLRNLTGASANFMMTFYGVRNLTLDGSFAGSGNYLRISNDNSSNNAGSLKFLNGCITDTVANCILESSSASTVPGNNSQKAATVLLDASYTTVAANANLVFKNNIFRNIAGAANLPPSHLRAINVDATTDNNSMLVTGNQFINSRIESIRTGTNSTYNLSPGWTITGNSIYATIPITSTSTKTAIYVNRGVGHIVSNNFIGGSNASAGGNPYALVAGQFTGISTAGGSSGCLISNNTVANVSITFATSNATGATLYGITLGGGGTASGNVVKGLTSNSCNIIGYFLSGSTDTAINNTVRNLTSTFNNIASPTARNVSGFNLSSSSHYIANNIIDSLTGSSSYYQYATAPTGIYLNSTVSTLPNTVIENNTITNIGNLSNSALTNYGATVTGITIANVAHQITVRGNYIANIYGNNTSAKGNNIVGILDNSGLNSSTIVSQGFLNNVIVPGNNNLISPTAWVSGIQLASAFAGVQYVIANNTITIPSTLTLNSAIDTARRGGASCVTRLNGGQAVLLQNNILSNLGENSNTGRMVAVNYLIDNLGASLVSDYNVYNTANVSNLIADESNSYSLNSWKTFKLVDSNSTNAPVAFTSATDMHINTTAPEAWNAFGRGIATSMVPTDKDGNIRSTTVGIPTTTGAYETTVPTSAPGNMTMIPATPAVGTPTEFWSNGRKIAEINWIAGATLPVSLSAKFYPGVAAPFLDYAPKTNAYFEINETGFSGTYTIKQYVNMAEGAGQSFSSLRAAKRHNTDPYTFIANAGSNNMDANGNYLQSTPQSTFSSFGMTSGITPLAIRLKDIEAGNFGTDNKVSWTTASEAKEDIFELQSAADGKSFKTIATINASGTPGGYDYWDRNAAKGVTYYRLKLNAANGAAEYSNIVTAVVSSKNNMDITVLPNPAADFITIRNAQKPSSVLHIELTDISGHIVKSVNTKETDTTIDLKNLPAGTYIVRATEGQSVLVTKVVKH